MDCISSKLLSLQSQWTLSEILCLVVNRVNYCINTSKEKKKFLHGNPKEEVCMAPLLGLKDQSAKTKVSVEVSL